MVWNYTTLKRLLSRHQSRYSFTTLWNYTTLKPRWCGQLFEPVLLPYEITLLSNGVPCYLVCAACFTTLWNYTTLKLFHVVASRFLVLLPYEITLLSNNVKYYAYEIEFYYLMKLHYSQTSALFLNLSLSFTTLWNYTTLKRVVILRVRRYRFTTLWNYTTLKPQMRISCDTTIHRVTS